MNKRIGKTLAAIAIGMATAGTMAGDNFVPSMGFESPMGSSQGVGARKMARYTEQLSKGPINFQLYPDSKLGSGPRMIEMVRKGELDILFGGAAYFAARDSRTNTFDTPCLVENVEQIQRAFTIKRSPRKGLADRHRRNRRMEARAYSRASALRLTVSSSVSSSIPADAARRRRSRMTPRRALSSSSWALDASFSALRRSSIVRSPT